MNASTVLHTAGTPVNTNNTPLTVQSGWNWLGYTAQGVQSVTQAFSGLQPVNGDLLKDQSSFATFDNGSWNGSLTAVQPGKAYIYQSKAATPKTFTYPQVAAPSGAQNYNLRSMAYTSAVSAFNPVSPNMYEHNMNVIAIVKDGTETLTDVELGAFVGSECRGTHTANDNGVIFLTIAGEQNGTVVDLKVAKANSEIINVSQTLVFTIDALTGTLASPYVIQIEGTGINDVSAGKIRLYPNPVKEELMIDFGKLTVENVEDVEIYDISGKKINNYQVSNNSYQLKINVSSLPAGVYFAKVGNYREKFVKK
jgi:hypothetical protein